MTKTPNLVLITPEYPHEIDRILVSSVNAIGDEEVYLLNVFDCVLNEKHILFGFLDDEGRTIDSGGTWKELARRKSKFYAVELLSNTEVFMKE